jgi:hypothetical protein
MRIESRCAPNVQCDSFVVVLDLDRFLAESHPHLLSHELVRNRVVPLVDGDVIVEADLGRGFKTFRSKRSNRFFDDSP